MTCFDPDRLILLSACLEDELGAEWEHVVTCERCRRTLQLGTALRAGRSTAVAREGFVDQVMAAVPVDEAAAHAGGARLTAWSIVQPALAAATALMATAAAGTAAPIGLGGNAVLAALASGALAAVGSRFGWWSEGHREEPVPDA